MKGSKLIPSAFIIVVVVLLFVGKIYAFSTSTSSISVSAEPGKYIQQTISVTLNNETLIVTRSGDKAAWISFSQTYFNYTNNAGTVGISVVIAIPSSASSGTHYAKIILKNETSSKEIPVTIQVQQPQQPWYSLQLPNNGWLEKGQSFLLDGVKITLYDVGQTACFLKLEGCADLYKKVEYGSTETVVCNGHKINITAITYFIPSQGNPLVQFEMKADYAFSASITPTQTPEQEQSQQTPQLKRLNVAIMPGFACPGQLVTIEVTDDTGRHVNAEGRITTSSGRSEQINIIGGFYDFIIPKDATYVIVRVFAEGYEPTAKVFEIDQSCRVTPYPPEQNQTQQTQQEQKQENQQTQQQCLLTLVINHTRVKTTEKIVATVFEDSKPSQGARVCFVSQTSQRCYLTNAQGKVEVNLPAGNYTVKAEKVNCQASNQVSIEVYQEKQTQQQETQKTQQQQIQRIKVILAPFINETRVNFTDLRPGDRVLFKLLTENGTVAKVDATLTVIHGNFTANITVKDGVAEQHVILQDTGNYAIKVTGSNIEPVFKEFEIHEISPTVASGGRISGKTILALITIIAVLLLIVRFRKKKVKPKAKGGKKAGFGVVSEKTPLQGMSKEEVEEELEEIS